MMEEIHAWQYILDWFENRRWCKGWDYLCHRIEALERSGQIDKTVAKAMVERIKTCPTLTQCFSVDSSTVTGEQIFTIREWGNSQYDGRVDWIKDLIERLKESSNHELETNTISQAETK
jgi:hypothetical protein